MTGLLMINKKNKNILIRLKVIQKVNFFCYISIYYFYV